MSFDLFTFTSLNELQELVDVNKKTQCLAFILISVCDWGLESDQEHLNLELLYDMILVLSYFARTIFFLATRKNEVDKKDPTTSMKNVMRLLKENWNLLQITNKG